MRVRIGVLLGLPPLTAILSNSVTLDATDIEPLLRTMTPVVWLLYLIQWVVAQDETMPLGAGLVVIDASCNMSLSVCASPPCRFVQRFDIFSNLLPKITTVFGEMSSLHDNKC